MTANPVAGAWPSIYPERMPDGRMMEGKWVQLSATFDPATQQVRIVKGERKVMGGWRVFHVSEVGNPLQIRVDHWLPGGILRMMIHPADMKKLRKGQMCNPIKLLKHYFEFIRMEHARIESVYASGLDYNKFLSELEGRLLNSLVGIGK